MGEMSDTEQAGLLIAFGGRPGSGKSTIAKRLARETGGVYLRVDTIEQAILASGVLPPGGEPGPSGYMALYSIAGDNLGLGRLVIADTVNPVQITRAAFRALAEAAGARLLQVEIVCSDRNAHRHRVETRRPEIKGHVLPTWQQVADGHYEPWPDADLRIDTSMSSVEESVALILAAVAALQ